MRKKLFFALLVFVFLFTGCGTRRNNAEQQTAIYCETATFDEGVVINGIRWATRNVDAPGTFAQNPEDAGMLFQWNRRKGWNAVDERVGGWDSSTPTGTKWYAKNDPCPKGWRVPTEAELHTLIDSEWITWNGINGRTFGTAPNQIFLPAAGWRNMNGILANVGETGNYWSSPTRRFLMNLCFGRYSSGVNTFTFRTNALSVRCVAIE